MNPAIDLRVIVLAGLVTVRVTSFLMSLPVLGVRTVPHPVRLALGLWMGVVLSAPVTAQPTQVPLTAGPLAFALLMEVLVGVVLAFGVVLVFATVQFAGQIIGIQIGFSLANVIDPQSNVQISVVSQFYNLVAALIFLAIGGPAIVLRSIADSFSVLRPGGFVPAPEGLFEAVSAFGELFALALRISLPVVVTLLLVSASLGVLGRTVPQMNLLVLGFPIKILVGSFVLAASVPLLGQLVTSNFERLPEQLARILAATAGGR